jgi:hypothetical protein
MRSLMHFRQVLVKVVLSRIKIFVNLLYKGDLHFLL